MPTTAVDRFLGINELVMHLGPYLDQQTLTRLMRASKQFNIIFTPFLFYELDFFDEPSRDFRLLLESIPIESLKKSLQHVRVLSSGPLFVGYYYQCLLKYELEQDSKHAIATYKPLWKPQADFSILHVVPLPPLANLTELNCLSHSGSPNRRHRCFFEGTSRNFIRQAEVLWVVKNCPSLINLGLEVYVADSQDILVLASVISKIPRLRRLEMSIQVLESLFPKMGPTLFFKAPTTVEELSIHFEDFADGFDSDDSDEEEEEEDTGNDAEAMSPGSSGADGHQQGPKSLLTFAELQDVSTRRQVPLSNLTQLSLQAIRYSTLAGVLEIFDHCPQIKTLCVPDLGRQIDADEVGRHIVRVCPNVRILRHTDTKFNGRLIMSIMGAMPVQQLEILTYHHLDKASAMTAMLTQRHSLSLRIIRFDECHYIDSKAIQSILVGCQGLEVLTFNYSAQKSIALNLADAVEIKWGATRLKTLQLVIALGDMNSLQANDPYYMRPAPIAFDEDESAKLEMLERLYTQIGELTQLEQLDLGAHVDINSTAGAIPNIITPPFRYATFPGLLSLGDPTTSRPGFLHLLGGLKNLKELKGSVHGGTKETVMTMGQREMEWVVENLVSLERADFCNRHAMVETGTGEFPWFLWLKDKRPKLKLDYLLRR
ncbi:MAG: hypothetical protein J3R72DRAFT_433979 [Linnemannia gamsii]|nr:MAG: hypothetical protein J3R72DRAFT_433979 [Linnemannia gamsii]